MKIDKFEPDAPTVCEVAVGPGQVIVNYQSLVGVGQWGHLSFSPAEARVFILTLQEALKKAERTQN